MAWLASQSAKRRPLFRFSLRATLLAVTAVCLFLSNYVKHVRDQAAARRVVESGGGQAYLDYHWAALSAKGKPSTASRPQPPHLQRLRELLGDDYFSDVVAVAFPYHLLTGVDTSALLTFRHLRSLNLSGTHVSDGDLAPLAGMTQLEELQLADTDITDNGIQSIAELPRLKILSLRGTTITDAALRSIARMESLKELDVADTNTTAGGLRELRAALKNCAVTTGTPATRTALKW